MMQEKVFVSQTLDIKDQDREYHPNRSKVDQSDGEQRVLCAEWCESVVDGLYPCLTPSIMGTTAVYVGDGEVVGVHVGLERRII